MYEKRENPHLFYLVFEEDTYISLVPRSVFFGLLMLVVVYAAVRSVRSLVKIRYYKKKSVVCRQAPVMDQSYFGYEPTYVKEQIQELNERAAPQEKVPQEQNEASPSPPEKPPQEQNESPPQEKV